MGLHLQSQGAQRDLREILSLFRELSLQEYAPHKPYDLLILEIGEDLEAGFGLVRFIQASGLVQEIFLTSTRMDPEFLIRALRAGAREFLPQPIKKEDVTAAIKKCLEKIQLPDAVDPKSDRQGKILYLMGSKGGVGTTTVAVNLAVNLVKGAPNPVSVALVDMNCLLGEIPIFLNINPGFSWGEVARNMSRLDARYLMSTFSKHASGIYVLPAPVGLEEMGASTPKFIEKVMGLTKTMFDFIVIDGGQSLDDVSLKVLEMTDSLCVITILSLPCLTNVKRLLRTFETLGYPGDEQIRIVVNRYHKQSLISLKDVEAVLNRKISGLIDNDYPNTMSAINQGKPLEMIAPGADVTKNIKSLAAAFRAMKKP